MRLVVLKSRRRQGAFAAALAVAAHLLAFLALGWRIPKLAEPPETDLLPPVEITLVRPPRPAPPVAPAPARAAPARPPQSGPPTPSPSPLPPVLTQPAPAAPQAPALAQGPPDCAVEDLPLLTDAEKAACRNEIDADKTRRLARGADDGAAKQVAEADRARKTFRADADREAYYDGLVKAQQPPGLPMVGPGVSCSHVTFPLLSGVDINPNLFAKKHKQEHPSHGSMTCSPGL
jgi:hypothetical protein